MADQHSRDYLERTIETVRNHRDADNCWPQWANIFADEIERLWSIEEQVEASRAEAKMLNGTVNRLLEHLEAARAVLEKIHNALVFAGTAYGASYVQLSDPLKAALQDSRTLLESNPASSPRVDSGRDKSAGVPEGNDGVRGLGTSREPE